MAFYSENWFLHRAIAGEVRAGAGEGGQTLFVSHRQTVGAEAGVQTCKRCLRVLGIESTSTCTCTIKTLSINNLLKANHTNKIQPQ